LQGLPKMCRGFRVPAAPGHPEREIVFDAEIRWSDCYRVLEQPYAVVPVLNLGTRERCESQQRRAGTGRAD
jgi:hypothetical protein